VTPLLPRATQARLLRFVLVGVLATLTQLGALALLLWLGWPSLAANAAALALSTHANFGLSACFIWGDRWADDATPAHTSRGRIQLIVVRWARFLGASAGTLLLNEAAYALARHVLPALVAAAACSGAVAVFNYLLGDRLVFAALRPGVALGSPARPDAPVYSPSLGVPLREADAATHRRSAPC
jgi:putative flippase GtrA